MYLAPAPNVLRRALSLLLHTRFDDKGNNEIPTKLYLLKLLNTLLVEYNDLIRMKKETATIKRSLGYRVVSSIVSS